MLGRSPRRVDRHLQEYLGPVRERLPSAARARFGNRSRHSRPRRPRAGGHRLARRPTANARRFIAGSNVDEVLAAADARANEKAGLHARLAGRGGDQRTRRRRYLQAYVDLIEGMAPTVNAWPESRRARSRPRRPDAAGQRLGQAFGARQPVRPDRPRRHGRSASRRGCGRCCAAARRAQRPCPRRHGIVS